MKHGASDGTVVLLAHALIAVGHWLDLFSWHPAASVLLAFASTVLVWGVWRELQDRKKRG